MTVSHATVTEVPLPEADDRAFLETLAQARAGAPEAQETLVAQFLRRVESDVHLRLSRDVRIGRPWLTARFSTGDIVQEVFRAVLRDLDSFGGRTEDAFCGYLAVVIRNRIVDSIRFHEAGCRDGRLGLPVPEELQGTGGGDPATVAVQAEEIERLEACMADLDPRVRLLVRARMEGQATFKELADQLGYGSESSARRAFFDAQAQLALSLGRDGDEGGQR